MFGQKNAPPPHLEITRRILVAKLSARHWRSCMNTVRASQPLILHASSACLMICACLPEQFVPHTQLLLQHIKRVLDCRYRPYLTLPLHYLHNLASNHAASSICSEGVARSTVSIQMQAISVMLQLWRHFSKLSSFRTFILPHHKAELRCEKNPHHIPCKRRSLYAAICGLAA